MSKFSDQKISQLEETKKKKENKKGPIIACVDTSGSIAGDPKIVAKTIILALLKVALQDNRKCYLISFSTKIQTLEISDMSQNLSKLIRFMQMGFYGGTDATPAFYESLKMLETNKFKKADVVIISNFFMPDLSKN